MQMPRGYKSNYPHNLFKNHDFISRSYSGEDYKLIVINYWLSAYLDNHSLIQVMFQNDNANDDEKIISVLFEALAQRDTAPLILNRHFFDDDQTTLTDEYLQFMRGVQYKKYEIPRHRYLPDLHYDSVLDKVELITKRAEMQEGKPAHKKGQELIRGNGCHAYALNILEALTDGLYPDPDFDFLIHAPELYDNSL